MRKEGSEDKNQIQTDRKEEIARGKGIREKKDKAPIDRKYSILSVLVTWKYFNWFPMKTSTIHKPLKPIEHDSLTHVCPCSANVSVILLYFLLLLLLLHHMQKPSQESYYLFNKDTCYC